MPGGLSHREHIRSATASPGTHAGSPGSGWQEPPDSTLRADAPCCKPDATERRHAGPEPRPENCGREAPPQPECDGSVRPSPESEGGAADRGLSRSPNAPATLSNESTADLPRLPKESHYPSASAAEGRNSGISPSTPAAPFPFVHCHTPADRASNANGRPAPSEDDSDRRESTESDP